MNDSMNLSSGEIETLETGLLLPLLNIVILPGITVPIVAGRPTSIAVAEAVIQTAEKQLILATLRPEAAQRLEADPNAEVERLEELYPVATLAVVKRMTQIPQGPIQLVIEGQERVRIEHLEQMPLTDSVDAVYEVKFRRLPKLTREAAIATGTTNATLEALAGAIRSLWREVAEMNPNFPPEVLPALSDDPAELAYQTSLLLQQNVPQMQAVLEEENLEQLLRQGLAELNQEVEVQHLRSEILGETKRELDQQQREMILRQQLQKIREELGEVEPESKEMEDLWTRLDTTPLPEIAQKQAKRELSRLERVGSNSAEGGVIRTYLDWLLEMPWEKSVEDNLDLQNAREVLDMDHYGLSKVKDRIIEHLATFKLKQIAYAEHQREVATVETAEKQVEHSDRYTIGTVLCFAGPPGVGKTSLGRSIARALGRPFERVSLGGLHDEAELRGHRRTYIGAMPGRIIQALHRAGVNNPVIMLDELDKVGMDYRGDPASVLLEILDPQQNFCFRDLYLDLDFDLSQIIFIGTANDLSEVPPPLLDRLEIIELSGYSEQEKVAIAQKYLLSRQLEKAGLPEDAVQLPPETLRQIIESYTREAGVRRLEQHLGALCRKVAVRYARDEISPVLIHPEQLEEFLGPRAFLRDEMRKAPKTGVATGLAWTHTGGEVLFVEAILLPRGRDLTLTGQLGEVMEESAQIAYSYLWANAASLGIEASVFRGNGFHIHIPAGAIPKDGPSAGVTMLTTLASLLMNKPVRTDTAMTGEINLSGDVLPIGGVREKVLAAHRAGIKRVLLPQQNAKDLVDVPEDVRQQMEFIFCERIDQVLENALLTLTAPTPKTNGNVHQISKPSSLIR
jgi:ATP-dependent Lon protease